MQLRKSEAAMTASQLRDEKFKAWMKLRYGNTVSVITSSKFIFLLLVSNIIVLILGYEWAYKAMAGYYDQTEWAVHGVLTNWTLGFAMFWPGMGFCIGLWLSKRFKVGSIWIPIITFLILMLFAYLFSLIGFAGFRFE